MTTWILITAKYLYLMAGGSDNFLKRQPRQAKNTPSYPLPASWFSEFAPGSVVVDLLRGNEPEPYEGELATPSTSPQTQSAGTLNMTPLRWDGELRVFKLQSSAGAEWHVNSGAPGRQELMPPEKDYSGSNRPIPQGEYEIGPAEEAPNGSWGSGLGPLWRELRPINPKHNRQAIGLHQDANSRFSPGSAGCVVNEDLSVIYEISDHCDKNGIKRLVVDYGF
jgi:hypothetical protein